MTPCRPTTVFISYSHKDKEWLEALEVHLKALEHDTGIAAWTDARIVPGDDWGAEVKRALAEAKIALFLLSASFCASEFIRRAELPAALKAAEERGLKLLPVYVKPCRVPAALAGIQAVNAPDRTLLDASEAERERVFVRIAEEIERSVGGTKYSGAAETALRLRPTGSHARAEHSADPVTPSSSASTADLPRDVPASAPIDPERIISIPEASVPLRSRVFTLAAAPHFRARTPAVVWALLFCASVGSTYWVLRPAQPKMPLPPSDMMTTTPEKSAADEMPRFVPPSVLRNPDDAATAPSAAVDDVPRF